MVLGKLDSYMQWIKQLNIMCTKCESGTGSFVGGAALDGYFFRLTQVAYISISVYCMSDFENENHVQIENGIESLGNGSRSGLGRIHTTA